MVAFDGGSMAVSPLTGQIEVIGTLPSDMTLTDMFLCSNVNAKTPLGPRRSTYV